MEKLSFLLTYLNMTEEEFSKTFIFTKNEIEDIKVHFNELYFRSPFNKKNHHLDKFIFIFHTIKDFADIGTPLFLMKEILNYKIKENKTLLEILSKKENNFSIHREMEELSLKIFKEVKIGKHMNEFNRINKEISKKFFKRKVDIKSVWIYTEGGDYTVPKVQELIKKYDDGSETWLDLLEYSQKLEDSLLILEELKNRGYEFSLSFVNNGWSFSVKKDNLNIEEVSESPSMSICRAVLKL